MKTSTDSTVPIPENRRQGLLGRLADVVSEASLLGLEKNLAGWQGGAVIFLMSDQENGGAITGPTVIGNTTNFTTEDSVMLSAMCWGVVSRLVKPGQEDHCRRTVYVLNHPVTAEGVAVNGRIYVFAGFPNGLGQAAALMAAIEDASPRDAVFWSTKRFAERFHNDLFRILCDRVTRRED